MSSSAAPVAERAASTSRGDSCRECERPAFSTGLCRVHYELGRVSRMASKRAFFCGETVCGYENGRPVGGCGKAIAAGDLYLATDRVRASAGNVVRFTVGHVRLGSCCAFDEDKAEARVKRRAKTVRAGVFIE